MKKGSMEKRQKCNSAVVIFEQPGQGLKQWLPLTNVQMRFKKKKTLGVNGVDNSDLLNIFNSFMF